MHVLLNLVCDAEGVPAAVLLRAVDISRGEALARRRRRASATTPREHLANGPGKLTAALGIGLSAHGRRLGEPGCPLQVHAPLERVAVLQGPRIGVDYAGAWAARPWRWWQSGYPVAQLPRPR